MCVVSAAGPLPLGGRYFEVVCMARKRAVLVTKADCQACEYVKSHIKDLPGVDDVVDVVDVRTADGLSVLAFHEMVNDAPAPFLEVDGEFYREGYKMAKDKDGREIMVAIRSKLVKKIEELCREEASS
ncbi:MAG: hypothetical protein J7L61_02930 [Thermoplasmata archaeon]|nr:hypothetical protein [Thermoplasmata archaeon]